MAAGRPRKLPKEEVLDAILIPFMRNGLHATSLTDLEVVTGLSKGSLYKAFPSKRDMFVATLERAMSTLTEQLGDIVRAQSVPFEKVNQWVRVWAADPEHMEPGVVLATRTSVMGCYDDPEVEKILDTFFSASRELLARASTSEKAQDVIHLALGMAAESLRTGAGRSRRSRELALKSVLG